MTLSRPEPLTCETALERLDAVWLDPLPEEPLGADVLAAREHVQECSACWAKWEERHAADQRIAEVMQAIPVPTGLGEQLLARTLADAASVSRDRKLRRRAWWISVAATLLVSFAGGSWLWRALMPHPVSMQLLCDQAPLTSAGLSAPEEEGSMLPPLPATWSQVKAMRIGPAWWFKPPTAIEPAGWVAFDLRTGKNSVIHGVLLMTRQVNVSDPPGALIARPSWFRYTLRDGKPVSVAGWSERGIVYLCFVPGEPDALERVLRATAPTSA